MYRIALILLSFILVIYFLFLLISARTNHLDAKNLELIEDLAADVSMKFDDELRKDRIRFLRLSPKRGDHPRNFAPLGTDLALRLLKSFEALDCDDFGDKELASMQNAERIEHLGLSGSAITDESLKLIQRKFPALRILEIKDCNISKKELLALLQVKNLLLLRVSPDMADPEFLKQVREVAPTLIYHCQGKDLLNQPESVTESLDWSTWED